MRYAAIAIVDLALLGCSVYLVMHEHPWFALLLLCCSMSGSSKGDA